MPSITEELVRHVFDLNTKLMEQNEALTNKVSELTEQIEDLNQIIKDLTEQLGKNSRNSSVPPSAEGYKKTTKSRRTPSGKKQGGQTGHAGTRLAVVAKPDKTIKHMPARCEGCPHHDQCMNSASVKETRHVVDIETNVNIVAHEQCVVECPINMQTVKGSFPEDVRASVQYGNSLTALVASLNTVGALSINRVHEILGGIFNIPIATGTITNMTNRTSSAVTPVVKRIGELLKAAYLVHCDETGTRVDKKLNWVHVVSNAYYTYLYIHKKRGKIAINEEGMLSNYHGIVVHDCWSSYWTCDGSFDHALCCAHLLRELTGVIENHPEQEWADRFIKLLLKMEKAVDKAKAKGKTALSSSYLYKLQKEYDEIIKLAYSENPLPENVSKKRGKKKKGKALALIERLDQYKGEVCRFTEDFDVPFDNNQAERDIRMVKTKTKVSGCFRTDEGAKAYLNIMSYIGTAKKQGYNAFTAVYNALNGRADFILAKQGC